MCPFCRLAIGVCTLPGPSLLLVNSLISFLCILAHCNFTLVSWCLGTYCAFCTARIIAVALSRRMLVLSVLSMPYIVG